MAVGGATACADGGWVGIGTGVAAAATAARIGTTGIPAAAAARGFMPLGAIDGAGGSCCTALPGADGGTVEAGVAAAAAVIAAAAAAAAAAAFATPGTTMPSLACLMQRAGSALPGTQCVGLAGHPSKEQRELTTSIIPSGACWQQNSAYISTFSSQGWGSTHVAGNHSFQLELRMAIS